MAEYSFPWDGDSGAGGVGDCGPYTAEFGASITASKYCDSDELDERSILPGWFNELGVIATDPASMNVVVRTGAALVYGRWYRNDAEITVAIANNAGPGTRYDRVVLRASWAAQTIRVALLQGVAGGAVPALTQVAGTTWEVSLATITVAQGAATIIGANIAEDKFYWNPRIRSLGIGDFEPDLAASPAVIAAITGVDTRAWYMDGDTDDSVYGTVKIPAEWGDTALAIRGYVWCITFGPVVPWLTVLYASYASGSAPANYAAWSLVGPSGGTIQRLYLGWDISVNPGDELALKVFNDRGASECWFLGLDLEFRR
jgi:hypothetical protein